MRRDKLSLVLLEAARGLALASIDDKDDQGLRDTLEGLRDKLEPLQYPEVEVRIDGRIVKQEPFKSYVEYLDDCLSDLSLIDAEVFDQATVALIQHLRNAGRLTKLVRQSGDKARTEAARAARRFDRQMIVDWYQSLPPARRETLTVNGLANWMLDNWDSELEGIKPPSDTTLRRILTPLHPKK